MSEMEPGITRPTIDAATLRRWIQEGKRFRVVDIRSPE
jgi:hypothetical protein